MDERFKLTFHVILQLRVALLYLCPITRVSMRQGGAALGGMENRCRADALA
jgi:hypothetical protein